MKVLDVDGLKRVVSNVSDKIAEEADARKDADTSLGTRIGSVEADLTGIKWLTYGANASKLVDIADGSYCSPALDEIQHEIEDVQRDVRSNLVNSIAPLEISGTPNAFPTGFAAGNNATASSYCVAIGEQATARDDSGVALGEHASSEYGGISIGSNTTSSNACVAIGNSATAEQDSIAIGDSTRAGNACVAIGSRSEATERASSADTNGVVSVGSDIIKRQIVNVADPTEAQDAATKNYVDTAIAGVSGGVKVIEAYESLDSNSIFEDVKDNWPNVVIKLVDYGTDYYYWPWYTDNPDEHYYFFDGSNALDCYTVSLTRISNAPAWNDLINKPFSTIGSGLKVKGNALTVNTATNEDIDAMFTDVLS